MRTFLGILLAILGLAAIALTIFGYGSMNGFWRFAHIAVGAVLIAAAVPLVRTEPAIETAYIEDDDSPFLP